MPRAAEQEKEDAMVAEPSPLRVLYSFPHPFGSPGIGRTAWHQADELARAGHQVDVVTTRLSGAPPPGVVVRTTLPGTAGRVAGRALGVDRVMAYNDAATARLLARGPHRPDVLHTWPAGGLRSLRTARRAGVAAVRELPNTHTAHAYAAANREAELVGTPLDDRNPHAFRERRLAREMAEYEEATALLSPSEAVSRSFTDRGFDSGRLLRHRYGFDPRRFTLEAAHRRQPSPGRLRALFVGRAEPRKGLHHALRAWLGSRASSEGTLTVCGTFVPGYREALADLLEHPSVRVAGFVADPAELYAASDVLVLPSVEEGSALVTYEASGMGCVPLVSAATGAECVDGVTGLVHPVGDVATLRAQLDLLVDDDDRLVRMQRACLAGRDGLTWEAGVAQTVAAYRQAMSLVPALSPARSPR